METTVKDVYAVGDLVKNYSHTDGTPVTMQLATSAYRQGMAAGINAAGDRKYPPYPGALSPLLTSVRSLEISGNILTILLEVAKDLGYEAKAVATRRENKPHYMPDVTEIELRVIVDEGTGKILGAQAIGEEGAGGRINVFACWQITVV